MIRSLFHSIIFNDIYMMFITILIFLSVFYFNIGNLIHIRFFVSLTYPILQLDLLINL